MAVPGRNNAFILLFPPSCCGPCYREREAGAERVAAQRKGEYEKLLAQIAEQARIAEENKGGFLGLGKKAQARKTALQKIAELQEKLREYPEFQMK